MQFIITTLNQGTGTLPPSQVSPTTWWPDRHGVNRVLRNGDVIELHGMDAHYFHQQYVTVQLAKALPPALIEDDDEDDLDADNDLITTKRVVIECENNCCSLILVNIKVGSHWIGSAVSVSYKPQASFIKSITNLLIRERTKPTRLLHINPLSSRSSIY